MHWLFILIIRFLRGERFTRDKQTEKLYSGLLVLVPFYIGIAALLFSKFSKNVLILWLVATASLTALYFLSQLWAKFISLKVSYIIGIIVWIIVFWIAAHIDLAKF